MKHCQSSQMNTIFCLFDVGNAAWQQRRRDHSVDPCVRGRALIFIFEQIEVFMNISVTA